MEMALGSHHGIAFRTNSHPTLGNLLFWANRLLFVVSQPHRRTIGHGHTLPGRNYADSLSHWHPLQGDDLSAYTMRKHTQQYLGDYRLISWRHLGEHPSIWLPVGANLCSDSRPYPTLLENIINHDVIHH